MIEEIRKRLNFTTPATTVWMIWWNLWESLPVSSVPIAGTGSIDFTAVSQYDLK